MKSRPVILLLLLALFALSANRAWACDGHSAKPQKAATEKSCCAKAKAPAEENHHPESAGSNCPCDHQQGGCHCPGCGLVGSGSTVFLLHQVPAPATLPSALSLQKLAFYFAGHLPEAVYLPVWQPPKLS